MKIAVLSRNGHLYSTRRIVEEGHKRGHHMMVVDHTKCDIIIEKECPKISYRNEFLEDLDAVIPRIGASVTFYGTAVVRQFEMMKVFSSVESQALMRSRDKLRSLQVLSRAGLGLPKTVFTNTSREVEQTISNVGGAPLVIKLLEGTQGHGVILTEKNKAAESVLEAFNSLQARVLVQEYISEANGSDLRAFVVDGEIVGAMIRTAKEGEFRSNLHKGGTAQLVQLSEEEKQAALKAARVMGLGVAGVDMLRSNRGPLILEVNSSPGLEGIEGSTGKNIAGTIIRFVERNIQK